MCLELRSLLAQHSHLLLDLRPAQIHCPDFFPFQFVLQQLLLFQQLVFERRGRASLALQADAFLLQILSLALQVLPGLSLEIVSFCNPVLSAREQLLLIFQPDLFLLPEVFDCLDFLLVMPGLRSRFFRRLARIRTLLTTISRIAAAGCGHAVKADRQ